MLDEKLSLACACKCRLATSNHKHELCLKSFWRWMQWCWGGSVLFVIWLTFFVVKRRSEFYSFYPPRGISKEELEESYNTTHLRASPVLSPPLHGRRWKFATRNLFQIVILHGISLSGDSKYQSSLGANTGHARRVNEKHIAKKLQIKAYKNLFQNCCVPKSIQILSDKACRQRI